MQRLPILPALALTALSVAAGCVPQQKAADKQATQLLADYEQSRALDYRIQWQTNLGLPADSRIKSIAHLNDVIVLMEQGNIVTVLDDATGKVRWRKSVGTELDRLAKPAVYDDHLILTSETRLHALRLDNGQFADTFDLKHNASTDPMILHGYVVLGSPEGLVFAQAMRGGYLTWRYQMSSAIQTNPLGKPGSLFVADQAGHVATINPQTGQIVWRRTRPPWGDIKAQPAADTAIAYVACLDQKLYAFDRATGDILWQYLAEFPLEHDPVVLGNTVLQRTRSRGVVALDTFSGQEKWRTDTPGRPAQVRNGRMIFVDGQTLRFVDARTGEAGQTVELPRADMIHFDAPDNANLYLLDHTGRAMKLAPQ